MVIEDGAPQRQKKSHAQIKNNAVIKINNILQISRVQINNYMYSEWIYKIKLI